MAYAWLFIHYLLVLEVNTTVWSVPDSEEKSCVKGFHHHKNYPKLQKLNKNCHISQETRAPFEFPGVW